MSKHTRSNLCKHLRCAAMFFLVGSILALASVSSNISLEKLSRKELAAMLLKEETRSRAYFELWRSKRPGRWKDIEQFESANRIADVRPCPLGESKKHGYLVVEQWEPYQDLGVYTTSDVERLFPRKKGYLRRVTAPFELISAEGETIQRGDMVSDGFLEDINGDGFIESVDARNGGFQELETGRVLAVSVVGEDRKCIFKVMYDWEFKDETSQEDPWSGDFPEEGAELKRQAWWFDVSDHDGDGCCEIELGPKTPYGVDCEVTFSWDASKGTYVSKQGTDGEHFHVMDPEKTWPDTSELPEKLRVEMEKKKLEAQKEKEAKEARKYRYRSLKGLTDEEILQYMAGPDWDMEFDGGDEDDKTKIPEGFWKLPPKKAAYELAEINRSEGHKRTYRLAVDDLDGKQPPAICSVSLDYFERFLAPRHSFFLRCDPDNSYFVYSVLDYDWSLVHAYGLHNEYELGFVNINYEEARHMADTIWWLNRVRTFRPDREVMASSTTSWSTSADTVATVRFVAGNPIDSFREQEFAKFVEWVPENWIGDYSHGIFVHLVCYLVDTSWTAHVKDIHPGFEGSIGTYSDLPQARMDKRKVQLFERNAKKVLELISETEDRISFDIAKATVGFAEGQGDEYVSILKNLLRSLPEIEKTPKGGKGKPVDDLSPASDTKPDSANGSKEDEIPEEMKRVREFREAVERTLQRIADADDPQKLEKMARERSTWAFRELKRSYTEKYLDILEEKLEAQDYSPHIDVFEEIAKVSPQRARKIAAGLGKGSTKPATVSILRFLAEDSVEPVENEGAIVESVVRIAEDPSVSALDQAWAIDALVPDADPNRFGSERIDEMLVRSLDKKAEKKDDAYRLACACEALARRGKAARHLSKFVSLLDSHGYIGSNTAGYVLRAAKLASQGAGPDDRRLLLEALRKIYLGNRSQAEDVIWAIWAGDFRELKKELEQIATTGVDGEEYLEQIATTGVDGEEYEVGRAPELVWKYSDRYHLARQLVSIWNEQDLATEAKLLIALAVDHYLESGYRSERFNRVKMELKRISKSLTQAQRSAILSFVSACDKEYEVITGENASEDAPVLTLSDIIRSIVAKKDASR